MSPVARNVIEQALSLPPLERAGLIERLLSSFDQHTRSVIDAAWAIEVERRIDVYEARGTQTLSLPESRQRINAK